MFDAFSVVFGCFGLKPDADQKPERDLIPAAVFMDLRAAFFRQQDRAIPGDTGRRPSGPAVPDGRTDRRLGATNVIAAIFWCGRMVANG